MKYHTLRFPGGKAKALTVSYDDGSIHDKQLIDIANRYGIKVTLNINSGYLGYEDWNRMTAEQLKEVAVGGHEIAVHGADHLALGKIAAVDGIREVLRCREELEKEFGGVIRGMAYAYSGITRLYSCVTLEEIKHYLKSLGIAYARTLGGDNDSFQMPADFLEWMPTAHHNNPELMPWLEKFLAEEIPQWGDNRDPKLFYLWGHSFEFANNNNWEIFENFCKTAGNRPDIWYATNIEICDYVAAFHSLQFSVDRTMVFNPTCQDIWLDVEKETVYIPAGKLTKLK